MTADSTSSGSAVRDGVLEIPGPVNLFHGGELPGAHIAWRLTGPAQAPVVVALGGISADRRVYPLGGADIGWWDEVVGHTKALPCEQYRLLSFDWLGGSGDSSGPQGDAAFPSISSYDQAEVLLRLLNHLGLRHVHAIVGASYGGMVALAFAERYPERVTRLCVISASDRAHPMATAWRSVQRQIIRFGLDAAQPERGLQLARALAMATYRSPEEFAARFSGSPRHDTDGFVFPVEEYLLARGADYTRRHRSGGFLCLSESIDLHRVDATGIFTPVFCVAVHEDQLVPVADIRAMGARLPNGKVFEISSVYGHDAFLKEAGQLAPIFARVLGLAL
jgi:homoserine O-acetyltransferase